MPTYSIPCTVFDPIRFTTSTEVPRFIVDTWFSHGLITQDLFTRLPGIPTLGTGRVEASSGMATIRPRVEIGIQINNIRALPISVYIIDTGPSDLLLGGDFLKLLFEIGFSVSEDSPRATIEPPTKREKISLALRLLSESERFTVTELERFIGALRTIHNCSIVIERGMYQHGDWPCNRRDEAIKDAVERTVLRDAQLSDQDRLLVTWIESGSIWVTIKSGAKSGIAWLSQLFRLTMNAKLEKTMAEAASAREKAKVAELTREQIVLAKRAEARLREAESLRREREEWRKMVLGEIDFRDEVRDRIEDKVVQDAVLHHVDSALKELGESRVYALIEHTPDDPEIQQYLIPHRKSHNARGQVQNHRKDKG